MIIHTFLSNINISQLYSNPLLFKGYPYIFPYRYSNNKEEFIDVIIQITKGLNILNDVLQGDFPLELKELAKNIMIEYEDLNE